MDDYFDEIAALAQGHTEVINLEEAAAKYEKEAARRVIKLWTRFAVHLPDPAKENETRTPLQTLPPVPWIKAYMSWRLNTGQARIADKISVQTLLKEYQQLKRLLLAALGKTWDKKEDDLLKKYIRDLKLRGASTETRQKSIAYAADSDDLQFFLWCCSERVYMHTRTPVHISLWLDIVKVWGLRSGEMLESSSHRGSNEGIHYGDATVSLARWRGNLRYQVVFMLRNRKFSRDDKGSVKGITLYEEMDPTVRWRCPFRKFLALALADNVFTHQRTPEDFDDRWISPTAASRTFQIKEDKKCLPLLRKIQGHRISSSKILSAMSMNAVLKELCEDAGYTERVTCYSFRRGFANKAEANTTSKKMQEGLSHRGERTWFAYGAPIMSLDAQAIAYDKPEDHVHIEFSQSIAYTRDFGGPKPANCRPGPALPPSEEILKTATDALPNSTPRAILRKAHQIQFKLDREKYQKEVEHASTPSQVTSSACNDSTDETSESTGDNQDRDTTGFVTLPLTPQPSEVFKQIMKYHPIQAEVIKALWHSKVDSLAEAVRPMMALSKPDPCQFFYQAPVRPLTRQGRCPYCGKNVNVMGKSRLARHLMQCHCSEYNDVFCYDCATFVDEDKHICSDSGSLNQLYGAIIWRGLLIHQGRCPFSLGQWCDQKRWNEPKALKSHVESHLRRLPDTTLHCPDEVCQKPCLTKHDLRKHLQDVHRIYLISAREALASCRSLAGTAALKRKSIDKVVMTDDESTSIESDVQQRRRKRPRPARRKPKARQDINSSDGSYEDSMLEFSSC